MRLVLASLAIIPILATAQDLGTYQITSGTFIGNNGTSTVTGNGFEVSLSGYPAPYYENGNIGVFGETDFSMSFSPPAGRDNGAYLGNISGLNSLTQQGFAPLGYFFLPYIQENGDLNVSSINVTAPGIYSSPFTMSVNVAYGKSGSTTPAGYVDFLGHGTMTVDVIPALCSNSACGPLRIAAPSYAFAPEIDPTSLGSALTLLGGALLVVRGRRIR